MNSHLLSKCDLNHRYQGVSLLGSFIVVKINFTNIKLELPQSIFWNGHVIDTKSDIKLFVQIWFGLLISRISTWINANNCKKILIFWISDWITFVPIWFQPSISRSFYFRKVYSTKIKFSEFYIVTGSIVAHIFKMVIKSLC